MTHSTSQTALEADRLTKLFAGRPAVDAVSFALQRGEVVGLVGPNGAGKTTLLRLLVGVLHPDAGHLRLFGQPLDTASQDRIAYLPEERGLYQKDRVGQTLKYLARLKGMSLDSLRGRIRWSLRHVGLADQWDERVSKLSKGQQQKVQFAAILVSQPDVILLDEPFSGLDPLNRLMVERTVRDLAAAGKAVLLSTHEMSRLDALCDRILMIHRGRLLVEGQLAEIRHRYASRSLLVEADVDLSLFPSVASVERHNGCQRVQLAHDATEQDFLAALLATGARIFRYELERPTIEEIFVRTVQENP